MSPLLRFIGIQYIWESGTGCTVDVACELQGSDKCKDFRVGFLNFCFLATLKDPIKKK